LWPKNRHGVTLRESADAVDLVAKLKPPPEVTHLLGSSDHVRFLKKSGYNKFDILEPDGKWNSTKFGDRCAGCHTTAVDSKTKAFAYIGHDCYTCHGVVDLEHTNDTTKIWLSKKRRRDVAEGIRQGRVEPTDERPTRALRVRRHRAHQPAPRVPVRNSGWHHERLHLLKRHRDAGVVLVLAVVIAHRLLLAVERSREHLDPVQPLDARHAVPARHHQAQRRAVLRQERRAVHCVGEQHLITHCIRQLEAARIAVLDAAVKTAVRAVKDDLLRRWFYV
jgi:hypothetical protein